MSQNRMPVVYVAGPYRAKSQAGIEMNITAAKHIGLLAIRKGWAPIIPHANTQGLDLCDPTISDEFWLAATMVLMRRCDAVVLVPGWEASSGTLAEIEEAQLLGIPVLKDISSLPHGNTFNEWMAERVRVASCLGIPLSTLDAVTRQ